MFQKLFKANQIKEIDRQTILRKKMPSWELMEYAGSQLFEKIFKHLNTTQQIHIFCGVGNNGGDALVVARLFLSRAIRVKCYKVPFSTKTSPDFALNLKKYKQLNGEIEDFDPDKVGLIDKNDLIIDGIFGTGLSRPAEGIAQKAIQFINQTKAKIISIDVPSGLYADKSNKPQDSIIKANLVYTFQFPKISFFFPENSEYVPKFNVIDIGLDKEVIEQMPTNYFLITNQIKKLLKPRSKFSYKNDYGHALIIGGSYGMFGAAILASKAALRIGAGLVSNFIPKKAYNISQTFIPEVMSMTDEKKNYLTKIKVSEKITAIGIGMGMGQHHKTQKALKKLLKTANKPLLLDADAINSLALHPKWMKYLPANSILTPHPGEFRRLTGTWQNDTEKLEKLKKLAGKHQLIMVLKGAYTFISDGQNYYINPIANPALATAGSGDVLSGMITGLLAQKHTPLNAALLGVYLHGLTAENYTKKYNNFSMIASDIINELKSL